VAQGGCSNCGWCKSNNNLTTNFKFFDAFADKDENINQAFPSSEWDLNFDEQQGTTTVNITVKHKTLADLEQIIQMGFKEGFTMTLNYLEELLATLSKKWSR
jgi:uncharacterized protein YndB with AHSA1/START domain